MNSMRHDMTDLAPSRLPNCHLGDHIGRLALNRVMPESDHFEIHFKMATSIPLLSSRRIH
jgi:hypothetical protein